MIRTSLACLLALCASAGAQTQTLVVPNGAATLEGNTSNQFPWGRGGSGLRLQCLYDSANFTAQGVSGPITITSLAWRPDAGTPRTWAATSYQTATIQLSTSPLDHAAASTSFGSNSGADATTVFSGPVAWGAGSSASPGPAPFLVHVPLSTPFVYDPTHGDLNVDIDLPVQAFSGTQLQFDASTNAPMASRVYLGSGYPGGSASFQANHGMVLEIGYSAIVQVQPLTPGNLVAVRVGDGMTPLTAAAAPVFLDEYTVGGTLVQSIPLPTTAAGGQYACTQSGTSAFEGSLSQSVDGRYMLLCGFNAVPGTPNVAATTSSAVRRVVARIGLDGSIDTSTALTDAFDGGALAGVASPDGQQFWVVGSSSAIAAGSGGVRYASLGGSTSIQVCATIPEPNAVGIYGDGLLVSSDSAANPGVYEVGPGPLNAPGQSAVLVDPGHGRLAGGIGYIIAGGLPPTADCIYYRRYKLVSPGNCRMQKVKVCGPWGSQTVTVFSDSQVPCPNAGSAHWWSSEEWDYFEELDPSGFSCIRGFDVVNATVYTVVQGGPNQLFHGVSLVLEPPSSVPHGHPCPGSAGLPILTTVGLPHIGFNLGYNMINLPLDIGAMVFSLAPGLSLDLGFLGAPGCTLYQNPDLVATVFGSGGTANCTLPIPNSPALVGVEVRAQGLSLDPLANALGLTTSNGLVATIGW